MIVLQAPRDGFEARAAAIVGSFTDLEANLKEDRRARRSGVQWFRRHLPAKAR